MHAESKSWRRGILKIINMFLPFRNHRPLGKGMDLHLDKLESPPPKDALCQVWSKLAKWFWRRRWRCKKSTDRKADRRTQDRQTTDNRWSGNRTWVYHSNTYDIILIISNVTNDTLKNMKYGSIYTWSNLIKQNWSRLMSSLSPVKWPRSCKSFNSSIQVWQHSFLKIHHHDSILVLNVLFP